MTVTNDEPKEDLMAAKDPVCGMNVDEAAAAATAEFESRVFYFCSQACTETFEADPAAYAG
ncbi:YHS domain-containing protein [Actinomarinicola tropica]|uniref:YHS domain-containing protein n=1 Tax=Actinomarinicola tropica TaxID=2789776 RepID=A0A5Q2RHS1_9ACTN|nr:YHS domain-containing protein [Actinomarinicola tropica]QGG94111.1 YHS domain-containing protein [Actinomarinicola tropica]